MLMTLKFHFLHGMAIAILGFDLQSSSRAEAQSNTPLQICASMPNSQDRGRCYSTFSATADATANTTDLAGGWKLIETTRKNESTSSFSVNHISDTSRSDLNMAGLSFRCGTTSLEAVLIMINPFSKGEHISVRLITNSSEDRFEASVSQQAETLVLKTPDLEMTMREWQNNPELTVELDTKPIATRGVIPIAGISNAWRTLKEKC